MRAYHYTNSRNWRSIQTAGVDGHITFGFDEFTGLIPGKRFVPLSRGENLPREAYEGVIEGLLEPEPQSWIDNDKFPALWRCLIHDICREDEIMLLSFELDPKDKAYVVDRAEMEKALYIKHFQGREATRAEIDEACRRYFESRVSVFNYDSGYEVPQLSIWSGIELDRLKVEWIKGHDEVWTKALETADRQLARLGIN